MGRRHLAQARERAGSGAPLYRVHRHQWLTPEEVLAEPAGTLDPHMHRFTRKLLAARPG